MKSAGEIMDIPAAYDPWVAVRFTTSTVADGAGELDE